MTRRILIEIALFVLPFVLQFFYFALRGEMRPLAFWPLRMLTLAGATLAIGALLIAAISSPSDGGLCYQAGRYEEGRHIKGIKLPCDQIRSPEPGGSTSSTRDGRKTGDRRKE